MLKRAKRFLTSRSTVLGLLLVLTAGMLAAALIPQVPIAPSASRDAPMVGPETAAPPSALVELLGLGHVFSTWWFAVIAVAFVLSLVLSTFDQFKVALARMRAAPAGGGAGAVPCAYPRAQVEAILAKAGYRRIAAVPGRTRHARYWLGYWGAFVLHAGMSTIALFAVVYVLTEHRVTVVALTGLGQPIGERNSAMERGLLGGARAIPATVTLLSVEPRFWEGDELQALSSQVMFTDAAGETTFLRVGLNDYQDLGGLVVYQVNSFGNTFDLEFRGGPNGDFDRLLRLPYPRRRDQASYGTLELEDRPLKVNAKYYARADRAGMQPGNPQLVLRLQDGDAVLAEVTLLAGESARLGPYQVRLASVGWWTIFLLEGSLGTAGIFTGFALLLAGGAVTFASSPREAIVEDTPTGCTVAWRPGRFVEFHREEGERLLSRCRGEGTT